MTDTKEFRGEMTTAGIKYQVYAFYMDDRKIVWVRVERTKKDGSKVWAFLSARQRYAESKVRSHFAKEINAI